MYGGTGWSALSVSHRTLPILQMYVVNVVSMYGTGLHSISGLSNGSRNCLLLASGTRDERP